LLYSKQYNKIRNKSTTNRTARCTACCLTNPQLGLLEQVVFGLNG